MATVETQKLSKVYGHGPAAVTALDSVSLTIEAGDFVAVMGPSGCGKSTLLHLIGGLDRPSDGRVLLEEQDLLRLSDDRVTELRRRRGLSTPRRRVATSPRPTWSAISIRRTTCS